MMAWRVQGRKGLTRDGDGGETAKRHRPRSRQHFEVLGGGGFAPRGHLAISRNIFYITTQGEGCTWHLVRDAAKRPAMHRTILHNEE